jgi:hypothetical protein
MANQFPFPVDTLHFPWFFSHRKLQAHSIAKMLIDLLVTCLFVLLAGVWYSSMTAREFANAAAKDVCARSGLSLLDETVAFARCCLIRVHGGGFALRRTYTFDYCEDGVQRLSGFIIMDGHQVNTVGLATRDVEPDRYLH